MIGGDRGNLRAPSGFRTPPMVCKRSRNVEVVTDGGAAAEVGPVGWICYRLCSIGRRCAMLPGGLIILGKLRVLIALATSFGALATTAHASLLTKTDNLIHETQHMQRVMGKPQTPTVKSYRHTHSMRYRRWVYHYWKHVNGITRQEFQNVPYRSAWECIHQYEGSWTDPGSPYYGGLQMDIGFQGSYGPYLLQVKGTADHWSPLEQMWVATKAYRSGRGFYPWPLTARYCGLI